jgi:RNAse (barnase) inhibitor barstar
MSGDLRWIDLRERLAGLRGRCVHVVHASAEPTVRRHLGDAGFEVVTVMGTAIRNEATFFLEVERAFALPEGFGRNWDAFTDALGDYGGPRLAVLWADSDQSLAADVQAFLDAVLALDRAAEDRGEEDPPRQLEVFLLGSGPGLAGAV